MGAQNDVTGNTKVHDDDGDDGDDYTPKEPSLFSSEPHSQPGGHIGQGYFHSSHKRVNGALVISPKGGK